MQFFKSEKETNDYCEAMEVNFFTGERKNETVERIKILEMNVKTEARRMLEDFRIRDDVLLKDTCHTVMSIIDFEKFDVLEIYRNLSNYIIGHTRTFINFHPVLRRISILVNTMGKLYNTHLSFVQT